MHGIPTMDDPRSKGNSHCLTLKTPSFQRYTSGPGKRVPGILNAKNEAVCSLCAATTMQRCGLICAISPNAFDCLSANHFLPNLL